MYVWNVLALCMGLGKLCALVCLHLEAAMLMCCLHWHGNEDTHTPTRPAWEEEGILHYGQQKGLSETTGPPP